ncbi:DUF1799 domain-containing protein [Acidovorax sp. Leaf160]|uniref:DUF1799 domain-containing protein n=1 Tax=Acidovorax sp. Leaf160 TaxID=1736280 RepID=UPI002101AECE|nr:DUF1799 domain-containing protein [Acidovorax sp. Leaf160]
MTEAEARADGFELEDYEAEITELEVWPDNELATRLFRQVGTRWLFPAMGGVPVGLRWEAIYPLMDRAGLDDDEWNDLHESLQVLESAAVVTMHEFAPKPEK